MAEYLATWTDYFVNDTEVFGKILIALWVQKYKQMWKLQNKRGESLFLWFFLREHTKTIAIDRNDDPVQYLVMRCPIFGHAVTNIWSCGNQRLVIG